jgi:hypothetical protein
MNWTTTVATVNLNCDYNYPNNTLQFMIATAINYYFTFNISNVWNLTYDSGTPTLQSNLEYCGICVNTLVDGYLPLCGCSVVTYSLLKLTLGETEYFKVERTLARPH